jgi:hypothetical protein
MLDDRQRKNHFSYPMRPALHFTWGYSQGQSNWGVKLTTFLRIMQRLRVSGGKRTSRHIPSYAERQYSSPYLSSRYLPIRASQYTEVEAKGTQAWTGPRDLGC